VAGGGLLAGGVGGQWTGHGIDVFVIDDPLKSRAEAESALVRERTWDWFTGVAYTRLEPGASVVVVQARWHPDDLAGRLIDQGWQEIRLPAIGEDGAALWPERWPVAELEKIKAQVGEYDWASLYQGTPRPRGGSVFHDAHYYDPAALPQVGYREAVGVDLAYTARTHADYSVAVLGRAVGDALYVTDVIRHQVAAPSFAAALAQLGNGHRPRMLALISGTEKGTVDFLAREPYRLPIVGEPATGDKFARAQRAAARWNAGNVLLPAGAPWLEPFLAVVLGFTGVNDAHDDDVDALAALERALYVPAREIREVAHA
jgi:predicted phage terminase large subunit-like protein